MPIKTKTKTKQFDIKAFRKGLESRLEIERSNLVNPNFCTDEKSRNETSGYIRCLENILFMLP